MPTFLDREALELDKTVKNVELDTVELGSLELETVELNTETVKLETEAPELNTGEDSFDGYLLVSVGMKNVATVLTTF